MSFSDVTVSRRRQRGATPAQPELTRRGMLTRLFLTAAPQASGSSGSATATTTVGTSP